MPDINTCLEAKKGGNIGIVIGTIGHIMLAILGILVIVMLTVPAYALDILIFLYYFGWIMAIIAVILAAVGLYLIYKRNKACLIA